MSLCLSMCSPIYDADWYDMLPTVAFDASKHLASLDKIISQSALSRCTKTPPKGGQFGFGFRAIKSLPMQNVTVSGLFVLMSSSR